MSIVDQTARIVIKQGAGVPTVPVSSDHRNGDWISTDIYEGEQYMDTNTGKLYTRNGSTINPVAASSTVFSQAVADTQTSVIDAFVSFTTPTAINMPSMNDGDRLLIQMACTISVAPASAGFGLYVYLDNVAYAHPSASTPTYANSFIQLPFNSNKCLAEIEVVKVSATDAFIIVRSKKIDGSFVATDGKHIFYVDPIALDSVTEIVPQAFITANGSITLDYFGVTLFNNN